MEWAIFLLFLGIWLFSLFLAREKDTYFRKTLFSFVTLILGASLYFTGLSFPNGFTIVTAGSTVTQTVQYITYKAVTTGTNASPQLWGISLAMLLMGIIGLLLWFVGSFQEMMNLVDQAFKGGKK